MFRTVSPLPCKQFNRESECRHAEVSWQEHTTPVVLQNKCWQTKQLQHIYISIYIYIYIYIYIQTCFCFKSQTAPNIPLSISLSASHQRHIYLIKCQQVQTKASFTDLQPLKMTKQICSISIQKTSNFTPVGKSMLRKCEAKPFMFLWIAKPFCFKSSIKTTANSLWEFFKAITIL